MPNKEPRSTFRFAAPGWLVLPWQSAKASRCVCGDPECRNVGQHTSFEVGGRSVDRRIKRIGNKLTVPRPSQTRLRQTSVQSWKKRRLTGSREAGKRISNWVESSTISRTP